MPRDGAIIFGHASKKLNAPYKSGPSKAWLKIKNPKAPAATRAIDEMF
jgi:ATP-dependent DNA ligase